MTFLIGKPKPKQFRNPIAEVKSQYRTAKTWLGDMVMCSCTFPHMHMRKGFFGWTCNNSNCRDFISNADAKYIERVKLDTESVTRFMNRRHSSNLMNHIKRADRTGVYVQAFQKD